MPKAKIERATRLYDSWAELCQAYDVPIGPSMIVDGEVGYLIPMEAQAELLKKIKADLSEEESAACCATLALIGGLYVVYRGWELEEEEG